MIVSINQPAYLPWLGYFHRIAASDLHIVLDHVQLEKNSFTNRNRIPAGDGACWLTVPLRTAGRFGDLALNTVEIENRTDWGRKHWMTIRQRYRRAPHFAEHAAFFEGLLTSRWERLDALCEESTGYLLQAFGIRTPRRRSSEMNPRGAKDELVLDLCKTAGATTYLSGALGRQYLREPLFDAQGIRVVYQSYQHPVYPQGGASFQPFMAAIDLLFTCGPQSLEILMRDQEALAA